QRRRHHGIRPRQQPGRREREAALHGTIHPRRNLQGTSGCRRDRAYPRTCADSIRDQQGAAEAVYHRSAFIAAGVPVFEIRERAGMTDMLIRDQALGRALAGALGNHPAALMRGHGAVVVGPSLQRVVGRSIFLPLNATLQMQAAALGGPVTYLDPEETRKIEEREGYGLARAWEAWKRKAMAKRYGVRLGR